MRALVCVGTCVCLFMLASFVNETDTVTDIFVSCDSHQ